MLQQLSDIGRRCADCSDTRAVVAAEEEQRVPMMQRGVTLPFLRRVVDELRSLGRDDIDAGQLLNGVHTTDSLTDWEEFDRAIDPLCMKSCTLHTGLSFVETCIAAGVTEDPDTREPYFSTISTFVSYTWRSDPDGPKSITVANLVAALEDALKREVPDPDERNAVACFVDVFVCAQHRCVRPQGETCPNKTDVNKFKKVIGECGRFILFATPIPRPKALTRVWCLYEIMAATQYQIAITVALSEEDRREVMRLLLEDSDELVAVFTNISSKDAEATYEGDREMVFKWIREALGEAGFDKLDQVVATGMRGWLSQEGKRMLSEWEDLPQNTFQHSKVALLEGLAKMYHPHLDELEEALAYYRQALELSDSLHGRQSETSLRVLGGFCKALAAGAVLWSADDAAAEDFSAAREDRWASFEPEADRLLRRFCDSALDVLGREGRRMAHAFAHRAAFLAAKQRRDAAQAARNYFAACFWAYQTLASEVVANQVSSETFRLLRQNAAKATRDYFHACIRKCSALVEDRTSDEVSSEIERLLRYALQIAEQAPWAGGAGDFQIKIRHDLAAALRVEAERLVSLYSSTRRFLAAAALSWASHEALFRADSSLGLSGGYFTHLLCSSGLEEAQGGEGGGEGGEHPAGLVQGAPICTTTSSSNAWWWLLSTLLTIVLYFAAHLCLCYPAMTFVIGYERQLRGGLMLIVAHLCASLGVVLSVGELVQQHLLCSKLPEVYEDTATEEGAAVSLLKQQLLQHAVHGYYSAHWKLVACFVISHVAYKRVLAWIEAPDVKINELLDQSENQQWQAVTREAAGVGAASRTEGTPSQLLLFVAAPTLREAEDRLDRRIALMRPTHIDMSPVEEKLNFLLGSWRFCTREEEEAAWRWRRLLFVFSLSALTESCAESFARKIPETWHSKGWRSKSTRRDSAKALFRKVLARYESAFGAASLKTERATERLFRAAMINMPLQAFDMLSTALEIRDLALGPAAASQQTEGEQNQDQDQEREREREREREQEENPSLEFLTRLCSIAHEYSFNGMSGSWYERRVFLGPQASPRLWQRTLALAPPWRRKELQQKFGTLETGTSSVEEQLVKSCIESWHIWPILALVIWSLFHCFPQTLPSFFFICDLLLPLALFLSWTVVGPPRSLREFASMVIAHLLYGRHLQRRVPALFEASMRPAAGDGGLVALVQGTALVLVGGGCAVALLAAVDVLCSADPWPREYERCARAGAARAGGRPRPPSTPFLKSFQKSAFSWVDSRFLVFGAVFGVAAVGVVLWWNRKAIIKSVETFVEEIFFKILDENFGKLLTEYITANETLTGKYGNKATTSAPVNDQIRTLAAMNENVNENERLILKGLIKALDTAARAGIPFDYSTLAQTYLTEVATKVQKKMQSANITTPQHVAHV